MAGTPKSSKSTPWVTCQNCSATILNKDSGQHKNDCPPDLDNLKYDLIINGALHGSVDAKSNEDIKNLSSNEKDSMVFLSQSVIQIINLSIGGFAVVSSVGDLNGPIVRTVWPTAEKSSSCILFTKNGRKPFYLI